MDRTDRKNGLQTGTRAVFVTLVITVVVAAVFATGAGAEAESGAVVAPSEVMDHEGNWSCDSGVDRVDAVAREILHHPHVQGQDLVADATPYRACQIATSFIEHSDEGARGSVRSVDPTPSRAGPSTVVHSDGSGRTFPEGTVVSGASRVRGLELSFRPGTLPSDPADAFTVTVESGTGSDWQMTVWTDGNEVKLDASGRYVPASVAVSGPDGKVVVDTREGRMESRIDRTDLDVEFGGDLLHGGNPEVRRESFDVAFESVGSTVGAFEMVARGNDRGTGIDGTASVTTADCDCAYWAALFAVEYANDHSEGTFAVWLPYDVLDIGVESGGDGSEDTGEDGSGDSAGDGGDDSPPDGSEGPDDREEYTFATPSGTFWNSIYFDEDREEYWIRLRLCEADWTDDCVRFADPDEEPVELVEWRIHPSGPVNEQDPWSLSPDETDVGRDRHEIVLKEEVEYDRGVTSNYVIELRYRYEDGTEASVSRTIGLCGYYETRIDTSKVPDFPNTPECGASIDRRAFAVSADRVGSGPVTVGQSAILQGSVEMADVADDEIDWEWIRTPALNPTRVGSAKGITDTPVDDPDSLYVGGVVTYNLTAEEPNTARDPQSDVASVTVEVVGCDPPEEEWNATTERCEATPDPGVDDGVGDGWGDVPPGIPDDSDDGGDGDQEADDGDGAQSVPDGVGPGSGGTPGDSGGVAGPPGPYSPY